MNSKAHLSIVSPVYGAADIVSELIKRIKDGVSQITDNYEIILVEDSSPDDSWAKIEEACEEDQSVKGVSLSRNFGQHSAISAGLELASGDYVVVMDCDLQHDPSYITTLYDKIKEGHDLVFTKTESREHGVLKNLCAYLYYKLLGLISDYNMDPSTGSFSILSRKVVEAYNNMQDCRKAYLWALTWLGFKPTTIPIKHSDRFSGKSSYSFGKLLKHALNVAVSNSDKLLYMTVSIGFCTSLIAVASIAYIVISYFNTGTLEGWASTMVAITFFSGLIISAIGVVGIYIAKIFEQTKGRPRFVISKTINMDAGGDESS